MPGSNCSVQCVQFSLCLSFCLCLYPLSLSLFLPLCSHSLLSFCRTLPCCLSIPCLPFSLTALLCLIERLCPLSLCLYLSLFLPVSVLLCIMVMMASHPGPAACVCVCVCVCASLFSPLGSGPRPAASHLSGLLRRSSPRGLLLSPSGQDAD